MLLEAGPPSIRCELLVFLGVGNSDTFNIYWLIWLCPSSCLALPGAPFFWVILGPCVAGDPLYSTFSSPASGTFYPSAGIWGLISTLCLKERPTIIWFLAGLSYWAACEPVLDGLYLSARYSELANEKSDWNCCRTASIPVSGFCCTLSGSRARCCKLRSAECC